MITQRQLFLQHLAQTTEAPLMLEIDHAEGVYLVDTNGKKYIDLISGIAVSNVGHRHPAVLQAIQEQLDKYLHTMVYGEYVLSPQVKLAKCLSDSLPDPLEMVYLVNSGAEAIEGSIKLAKRFTGRPEIVSCFDAYHGSTHGALSIGGSEQFKQAYRPLIPGNRNIRFNQLEDLELIGSQTAAVVIETVQGEAGVRVASTEYFQAIRTRCTEVGALLVLDEIQAGFGRTGTFWAFEQYGIVPDIVACAKGMGGGMPIGAFIASKEIMWSFTHEPILGHITTFGGHPVSAAASLATFKVIDEEKLWESAQSKGAMFEELLRHERISEVRSAGLMIAVEFESFSFLQALIRQLLEQGIISDWFLYNDRSMRIAPPLITSEDEIKKACNEILQALEIISRKKVL